MVTGLLPFVGLFSPSLCLWLWQKPHDGFNSSDPISLKAGMPVIISTAGEVTAPGGEDVCDGWTHFVCLHVFAAFLRVLCGSPCNSI